MHDFLSRSSGNVIGIKVSGKLSHSEYTDIIPYIEKHIKRFKNVRLLIELTDFKGWDFHAAMDDLMFIFKHRNSIEQLALVVDKKENQWSILLDQPFGRLAGAQQRIFDASELDKAWEWIERGKTTLLNINTQQYRQEAEIRYGSDMRVLIVGGGITALTLGALLKQRGFKPDIIGKKGRDNDSTHVATLWPMGSSVLKGLGLYPSLKSHATLFKELSISDSTGKSIHTYQTEPVREAYGSTYNLKRIDLKNIIKSTFSESELNPDAYIDKIEQTNKGVEIVFTDGQKANYDIVVGCDGLDSSLREKVLGRPEASADAMYRWNFEIDKTIVKKGSILEYWKERNMVGLYSIKDHASVIMATEASSEHKKLLEKDYYAYLKEHFSNFGGEVPSILASLDKQTKIWCHKYRDVKLDDWHKGRVVFIGDAAFSTLPMTGLGISMAMESASVLAEQLTRADSCYISTSLTQFVNKRHLRVKHIERLSYLYDQIREPSQSWLGRMKNKAFHFFTKDDFVQFWNAVHAGYI